MIPVIAVDRREVAVWRACLTLLVPTLATVAGHGIGSHVTALQFTKHWLSTFLLLFLLFFSCNFISWHTILTHFGT